VKYNIKSKKSQAIFSNIFKYFYVKIITIISEKFKY
jgi:hypothetical protein